MNALDLQPLLNITVVLVALPILALVLRFCQRRFHLEPETVRKLFHVGAGLISLSLPWLFDAVWPVLLLWAISVGTFVLVRRVQSLESGVGQVLHAVQRRSGGEFWFLSGVVLVFLLADGDKLLFVIPVLILTVADTAAALVGVAYGRHRYKVLDWKSVEGSITFFLAAFLCTHFLLLLWGDVGRQDSVIIAAHVAFVLMLVDATAWRGSDNLLIPVVGFVLLDAFLGSGVSDLGLHLAVLVGLLGFVCAHGARFSSHTVISMVLAGYAWWALSGPGVA